MNNTLIKERFVKRIDQLLEKAQRLSSIEEQERGIPIESQTFSRYFFEWKTSSENLIVKVAGENSSYYRNFCERVKEEYFNSVESGMGILNSLKEDIGCGLIDEIEDFVVTKVFADFLEMSEQLLKAGHKDPAALLIGAVLENGLRKIAKKKGVQIKTNDDISALNAKLAASRAYNRLVQQEIQLWKTIRNSADHGKFDEYEKDKVEEMMKGVKRFLKQNL